MEEQEQGTPQERIGGDDPGPQDQEGGADSPTDAERQGSEDDSGNEPPAPGAGS